MTDVVQQSQEAVLHQKPEPRLSAAITLSDIAARHPAAQPAAKPPAAQPAAGAFTGRNRRGPFRPKALIPSRSRLSGAMLARMFKLMDIALVAAVTVAILSNGSVSGLGARTVSAVTPFVLGGVLLSWTLKTIQAYDFPARETLGGHLLKLVLALAAPTLAAAAATHILDRQMSLFVVMWSIILLPALFALHGYAWVSVRRWRKGGRLTPNVVVVGATQNAARLIEAALASREIAVLGVFDDRLDRAPDAIHGVPVLGDTKHLLEHRILPYIDRIVITVTSAGEARVRELITTLRILPHPVTLFMDVDGQDTQAATLSRLTDTPLAQLSGVEFDEQRALIKRLQDLVVGGLALIIAAPVMVGVAAAVRIGGPGPILFRQNRHGFNNEIIAVWKFRSMRVEVADAKAERQVSAHDDRITRVGRFIRKTSLDELPQLWNVMKGEMSLVGPRPHAIGMKSGGEESSRLVAEYAWRHRMKPGITGWAQIKGSRGPVDTAEQVRTRVALDIDYIERQSFWFDVYILLMTVPCLFGDTKTVR